LINDDLKHPRINILHTPERKQDAQAFYSKYTNLGAIVTLIEVDDDLSTRKHLGKLYYFDDSPRFREMAYSLAKDLRGIELISPHHFKQVAVKNQPHYAIWIVKSCKVQTNQFAAVDPKPIEDESLIPEETVVIKTTEIYMVQCPKCPSPVRNDRLAKHLLNVHSGKPRAARSRASFGHHQVSEQAAPRDNRF
jgi:hypothetical protein